MQKHLVKTSVIVIIIAMVYLIQPFFTITTLKTYADERYKDLQLFTKVLNYVQQYYVEDVDTKKLILGSIKGMLGELDPHTNYLTEDVYREFANETSGKFGGIGIEITIQKDILTVISPIEDTPAWKAGIKAGDKITAINGESTKGLSLAEAAQRLRGKRHSVVKLGIYRDGFKAPRNFSIKRGDVKIKSVKYTDLNDGYAYIKITSFIENTSRDLKGFIAKHKKNNKKVKGIIIDLRKNPGGLLDQAVAVSDTFLDKGKIVITADRNEKDKKIIYAKKSNTILDIPIVVLIDEYSASASEIVAGALQDNKRALILGKRSFGKGSVQNVIELGKGNGALKLTIARYYTPSGRSIQAEGVMPDVEVDYIDAEALSKAKVKKRIRREKDMRGHLLSKDEKKKLKNQSESFKLWWLDSDSDKKKKLSSREKLLKKDFQVFQAYNYLKAWKVMKGI